MCYLAKLVIRLSQLFFEHLHVPLTVIIYINYTHSILKMNNLFRLQLVKRIISLIAQPAHDKIIFSTVEDKTAKEINLTKASR